MTPIGHFAAAFAAKPAAPKVNIFVLLSATLILDFLFFIFALVGLEGITKDIYWSHSLFMSVVWSLAFGWLGTRIYRDRRAGWVIGLLVFSHWVLDFVSHPMGLGHPQPPDIPLIFHVSRKVALGLYNSISVTQAILIEVAIFIPSAAVYVSYILRERKNKLQAVTAGGG